MYIWANTLEASIFEAWTTVNFHINGDGPLQLFGMTLFNPNHIIDSSSIRRWAFTIVPPLDPASNQYTNVDMATNGIAYGIQNPPLADGYTDGPTGNVLLGYFDVAYDRSAPGAIWLEVGTFGGAALEYFIGAVRMQMGFGDTSL